MDYKTMLQLPALDISEVVTLLQQIADKERHQDKPNMPMVTITTHTSSASGIFVNYDSTKGVILLCELYDRKAQLQYLQSSSIASVSIRNIESYAYLLSDGTIAFTPPAGKIPTMLQLKKEMNSVALDLKATLNKQIAVTYSYQDTPNDNQKYYAHSAISLLKDTMANIAKDNLSKVAFTESVSTIQFNLDTTNAVSLAAGTLSITLDVSKSLKSVASAHQLQELIEACL
ncbi:hypothetical protein [Olleya namhaensis]|uniref:hypothetical protein n=1 Tax=Olleya namhaensis TaxID=1144750 RepID=UPI00249117FD|nr:hypothetical protein [Olleya namhaensis]